MKTQHQCRTLGSPFRFLGSTVKRCSMAIGSGNHLLVLFRLSQVVLRLGLIVPSDALMLRRRFCFGD
jgi:hypothetical protein